MIVVLRVGIGWHFLYEGVHKFDPAKGFSSEGFLGVAKGPTAGLYYWMLADYDGIMRLEMGEVEDADGKRHDTFIVYENAWKEYFEEYRKNYPDVNADRASAIFNQYLNSLRAEAADVKEAVNAFKASRERFLAHRNTVRNSATFEQQRRWQMMIDYRAEAGSWIKKLNAMGNALQSDLGRLADPQLAGQRGEIVTAPERELIPPHSLLEQFGIQYTIPPNPYIKSRIQAMDYAVMFGLSAIGLCLILGFCTRLACLGGAVFLVNVVLTTFPVPGIYPEIPTMVGNFMFVSKDVIELLALLVLALLPSGRWGGLDYFLWNYGGKQIVGLFCPCKKTEQ